MYSRKDMFMCNFYDTALNEIMIGKAKLIFIEIFKSRR
jgi:hypothetical protein